MKLTDLTTKALRYQSHLHQFLYYPKTISLSFIISLRPTFTEKHNLKFVSKERKCRSEDNYNYNYEFNRSETNEFKTIAYRLKQSREGYIGNLTKCINRATNLLDIPHNTSEAALIKKNLNLLCSN